MDQVPLVMEEVEAGAELIRAFEAYAPVSVAFWAKLPEQERYLYIASDHIIDQTLRAAYAEVARLTDLLHNPYLDPSAIKLVNSENWIAQAARSVTRRFPKPVKFLTSLGIYRVDDAYVYPSPLPAVAVS